MYKISTPILLSQIKKYGIGQFIDKMREIGTDMAFIAIESYTTDKKKQEEIFSELNKNVPLLKEAGFTVGVWLWTFMVCEENSFTHITGPDGKVDKTQCCPSDKEFLAFVADYLKSVAKSGADMILFDDDFRYGFLSCGLGCTCKNHRAHMESTLGEKLPSGDLSSLILSGGKNKYRSAFLKANGHYFREFARNARSAVNEIKPDIRIGLCSCMTTWDFDGVSTPELAKILAGDTKPFCRLIGAPYWATNRDFGNRLSDVIELERMESSWCDEDIEILAEGDTYPRPGFTCPANVLEGFDMALRASGATNGIHKYTLDYYADVSYEPRYNEKHLKNGKIYSEIERLFSDKEPVGIRIYERMTKFEDMDVPPCFDGKSQVQDSFFSPASKIATASTLPTVYQGLGTVGIAFGENVKYLDPGALEGGLILDVRGAEILEKMGIDTGLSAVGEVYTANEEYFPQKNRYVLAKECPVTEISVKEGARVWSKFIAGGRELIGSYTYENGAGQKFLVYAFEGYTASDHVIKQYERGDQILEWIASLGKKLPATMPHNPDCYILAKKSSSAAAVWIGNFFADECMNTTVALDKEYKEIEFINCTGRLLGDKVTIDAIPPYASLGFAVK